MVKLITICAIIDIIILFYKYKWGLYFYIVLIPFIVMLPATPIPGFNGITVLILIIFILSFKNKTDFSLTQHSNTIIKNVIILLLIYCLISWLSTLILKNYYGNPSMDYLTKLYRWQLYFLNYFIIKYSVNDNKQFEKIILMIALGVFLEGIFGAKAYILAERRKLYGSIGSPNELALFFAAYLPVFIVLFYFYKSKFKKLIILLISFFPFFSFIWALSRGGYLSFAGSLSIYLYFYSKKYFFIALLMLMIGGGFIWETVIPEVAKNRIMETFDEERIREGETLEASAYSRVWLAKAGWNMFIESPVWGIGWGMYPKLVTRWEYGGQYGIDNDKASHNMYVRILSELGIIGFLIFILLFIIPFKSAYTLLRSTNNVLFKHIALFLLGCIIAFIIGNIFGDRFFRGSLISYYLVLVALVEKARQLEIKNLLTSNGTEQ